MHKSNKTIFATVWRPIAKYGGNYTLVECLVKCLALLVFPHECVPTSQRKGGPSFSRYAPVPFLATPCGTSGPPRYSVSVPSRCTFLHSRGNRRRGTFFICWERRPDSLINSRSWIIVHSSPLSGGQAARPGIIAHILAAREYVLSMAVY
jgi:hypothetical protein